MDSYYLDRRIHISVPKQPYPYKITEFYDEEIENIDYDENYDIRITSTKKKNETNFL